MDQTFDFQALSTFWNQISHYVEYVMYGLFLLAFLLTCAALGRTAVLPQKPDGEGSKKEKP